MENFNEDNGFNIPEYPEDMDKNRKVFKKWLSVFFVFFLVAASFFWGINRGKIIAEKERAAVENITLDQAILENKFSSKNKDVDFSLFWKVWELLKEKHIDKASLNAQKLVYGAISGMLEATGDPYTSFFNPEENASFTENIEGSFDGIGAELGIKDELLTVIAPLEGSPSEKAGMRAGDKIIKVGDKIVADMSIDDAVKEIRGKKGTEVRLTILREGEDETKEITIIRDTIEIKTVSIKFKENDVAYLKISRFGEKTSEEFDNTISEMLSRNSKGIILDLRNNPGGLLNSSIEVASRMIPKGKIVVSEEYSNGKKDNLHTLGGDKLSTLPIVVLINEGSASASEIVAGALKDNLGTVLIGEKSFGKGSVQEMTELPGGSSVKITVAKWLTPNGNNIMDKGIEPDIEIEFTEEDYKNERDPQLDKALEVLKEKMK